MEIERKMTKSSQCCGAKWSKMTNLIWLGTKNWGEFELVGNGGNWLSRPFKANKEGQKKLAFIPSIPIQSILENI